jgi:hypothetical protein
MLVLGLCRAEVLGLPWSNVSLDAAELDVSWQLQRTERQLHHRETKTPGSDAPLPVICATALSWASAGGCREVPGLAGGPFRRVRGRRLSQQGDR